MSEGGGLGGESPFCVTSEHLSVDVGLTSLAWMLESDLVC